MYSQDSTHSNFFLYAKLKNSISIENTNDYSVQ